MRAQQSAQTRAVVISAARRLFFEEGGYARTSMSAIAQAAGVSVQTIYNTFGSKSGLLKAVFDTTLAGDDEPIPMGRRPEFLAMEREQDPSAFLHHYARIAAMLMKRLGPFYARIREGAGAGDPDLTALLETTAKERLVGATEVVRVPAASSARCDPASPPDAPATSSGLTPATRCGTFSSTSAGGRPARTPTTSAPR